MTLSVEVLWVVELERQRKDEVLILERGLRIATSTLSAIRDGKVNDTRQLAADAVDAISRVSKVPAPW